MYDIIIIVTLLLIGYIVGSILEKRHYLSIRKREEELALLPTVSLKVPLSPETIVMTKFVTGNVVISIDYFKKMLAALRNIFGGNVSAYETLLDRGRREAILRLKEKAKGANEVINLRLETSSISQSTNGSVGSIEVLAYGTAIYRK